MALINIAATDLLNPTSRENLNTNFINLASGWVPATGTWTYSSADSPTFVITVPTGATAIYSAGMRIWLTQTTSKYFIITAVADTALTVYGGTDYTLANAAITSPYFSPFKAPFGFPLDPTKWTIEYASAAESSQVPATSGTYYNLGTTTLSIPIGVWNTYYEVIAQVGVSGSSSLAKYMEVTLSTANNSESDNAWTFSLAGAATELARSMGFKSGVITRTTKASYYLNGVNLTATSENIYFLGSAGSTLIRAVSAYL